MSVVKVLISVLLALGGLGAVAYGVLQTPQPTPLALRSAPAVAMRSLPGVVANAPVAAVAIEASKATPASKTAPDAGAISPAPIDAGAPEVAIDAGVATEKVDAGLPTRSVDAGAPAKAPAPPTPPAPAAPAPAPAKAPPAGEALLNLQASDTADVYIDGRKVGSSPLMGFKVKSGTHKVRFDCYDAAGNAMAGQLMVVTVTPDKDQDIEYTCPEAQ